MQAQFGRGSWLGAGLLTWGCFLGGSWVSGVGAALTVAVLDGSTVSLQALTHLQPQVAAFLTGGAIVIASLVPVVQDAGAVVLVVVVFLVPALFFLLAGAALGTEGSDTAALVAL